MCSSGEKKSQDTEQREAVILFADLMNSSELSNVLPSEEYDKILTEFQEKLGEVVEEEIKNYDSSGVEAEIRGDEICVKFYRAKDKKNDRKLLEGDIKTALKIAINMKRKWVLSEPNTDRLKDDKLLLNTFRPPSFWIRTEP